MLSGMRLSTQAPSFASLSALGYRCADLTTRCCISRNAQSMCLKYRCAILRFALPACAVVGGGVRGGGCGLLGVTDGINLGVNHGVNLGVHLEVDIACAHWWPNGGQVQHGCCFWAMVWA